MNVSYVQDFSDSNPYSGVEFRHWHYINIIALYIGFVIPIKVLNGI